MCFSLDIIFPPLLKEKGTSTLRWKCHRCQTSSTSQHWFDTSFFVIIPRKKAVCKCFFWNKKVFVIQRNPAKITCFLPVKMVFYICSEYGNAMTKEVECSGSVREWRSPAESRLRSVHLKFPFEHQCWRFSGRLRRFGLVIGQECPIIVGNAGGTAEALLSSQSVDGGFFIFQIL